MSRFSRTVRFGKIPRPSGMRHTPARARRSALDPVTSWPSISTAPPVGRTSAAHDLEHRRLARAVGSEHGDDRAARDDEVDPVQHLDRAVAGPQAAELHARGRRRRERFRHRRAPPRGAPPRPVPPAAARAQVGDGPEPQAQPGPELAGQALGTARHGDGEPTDDERLQRLGAGEPPTVVAAELAQHLGEHHEEQRAQQRARHARDAEDGGDEQHGERPEVEEVEAAHADLQGAEQRRRRNRRAAPRARRPAASRR